MLAPMVGRALPRNTPQPVVCGQFPSSHKPTIGMAMAIRDKILLLLVKIWPHLWRIVVVKVVAIIATTPAHPKATSIAVRALPGRLAPSSLLTRVDTAKLSADGKMYTNDVVWIKMPMLATVASALINKPERMIMNSYHHHSKHTDTQLGMAKFNNGLHSFKHCIDHPVHDFLYLPDHHRYTRRKPTRLKSVHEAANATPRKPILSALTNKKLMVTWKMRARAAHHVNGMIMFWVRR